MQAKQERITIGQEIYYFEPNVGWQRGRIEKIKGNNVLVIDHETQKLKVVTSANIHGFIPDGYNPKRENLFDINDLHVATVLFCIKERFVDMHQQYSRMGEMLLSVNPFEVMPFNSTQERRKYLSGSNYHKLPPHIWQVARRAYEAIVEQGLNDQSIIISGESGSGKTENTKSLVSFLGQISREHSDSASQRSVADRIDNILTWSNPVMESFGNARTVYNDNSSRFGKYIKLYFNTDAGILVGGTVSTYLLEKSRIVTQSAGERNYHIFYEMLAGLSTLEKQSLGGLKSAKDYRCLNGGDTFVRRGVDGTPLNDAEEFMSVRRGMKNIGMPEQISNSVFRVLAAILHMFEVQFEVDDNDKAHIVNEKVFLKACNLLRLDAEALSECFLIKSHSSLVTIYSTKVEAEFCRNAFCKVLYLGLFDRIVEYVNQAMEVKERCENFKYIGLLDIFGFENFEKNSFEQLCINFANETLQNHYNRHTYLNDDKECESEGIPLLRVHFADNAECIRLFTEPPHGIFPVLNEESNYKGGTSASFTRKLWEYWKDRNPNFVAPKSTIPDEFGIQHYAAFVNYNTDGWTEKNADPIKDSMYKVLASSKDDFIATLLSGAAAMSNRKKTVSTRFQLELGELHQSLTSTQSQFIRCIKPNMQARPQIMENYLVSAQLESAGVLQTILLKRNGYPVRRVLEHFCRYFYFILPRTAMEAFRKGDYRAASCEFLHYYDRIYQWRKPHFAIGKTKVFLKADVWCDLERLVVRRRVQLLSRCKRYLVRWARDFLERKRIENHKRIAELQRAREEREAKAALCAHGLPNERFMWVENLSNLFPLAEMDILFDVAAGADNYEKALSMVTSIEQQCLDKRERSAFLNLMRSANVRAEVVQRFLDMDINSIAALDRIPVRELPNYGCSQLESAAVTQKLRKKELDLDHVERLSYAIGTHEQYAVAELLRERQSEQLTEDFDTKVQELMALGFDESLTRLVLAHYDGEPQRAANRLLHGVNQAKMQKRLAGRPRYTTADPLVQKLIAMGASKRDAKAALRYMDGNVDHAAKALFAASSIL